MDLTWKEIAEDAGHDGVFLHAKASEHAVRLVAGRKVSLESFVEGEWKLSACWNRSEADAALERTLAVVETLRREHGGLVLACNFGLLRNVMKGATRHCARSAA